MVLPIMDSEKEIIYKVLGTCTTYKKWCTFKHDKKRNEFYCQDLEQANRQARLKFQALKKGKFAHGREQFNELNGRHIWECKIYLKTTWKILRVQVFPIKIKGAEAFDASSQVEPSGTDW
jgi:hypothetical protein